MPLFKRKQKEGQTSRPKTGEISFKNTPRETTKKKVTGQVGKKTVSTLEREMINVTQYPKNTTGNYTSQLTRYEVPMKKEIAKPKAISRSFKTKKTK